MTITNLYNLYNIIDNNYDSHNNNRMLAEYVQMYNGVDWKYHIKYSNCNQNNNIRLDDLSNSKFELYIILWKKISYTNIIDHSYFGGITKVLEGKLIETLYDYQFNILNTTPIYNNYTSFIDTHPGLHSFQTDDNSVSLHLVYPPIYTYHTL